MIKKIVKKRKTDEIKKLAKQCPLASSQQGKSMLTRDINVIIGL